jgi:hypothetical protein
MEKERFLPRFMTARLLERRPFRSGFQANPQLHTPPFAQ